MIESINSNYNLGQKRSDVAEKIRRVRNFDEIGRLFYFTDRSSREYFANLEHLDLFLEYININCQTKSVLDIGAGSTKAISQIAQMDRWKDLRFEATVLSMTPYKKSVNPKLDSSKIHITSTEVFRGIPSESFGGAIGYSSVNYSAAPELAARSIDRILIPGGIFKGLFLPDDYYIDECELGQKKRGPFERVFKELGYDTAINDNFGGDLLLAKKKGANAHIKAADLI